MKNLKIILIFILCSFTLKSKIRIMTFCYNRADLIELQYKCFCRFLKDDWELIVFNDASVKEDKLKIKDMCNKLNIFHIRFPQKFHKTSALLSKIDEWKLNPETKQIDLLYRLKDKYAAVRHSNVIQYALDNFGYHHNDIIGLIDGDMFLVREVSIKDELSGYDILGYVKEDFLANLKYINPAFVFFNPNQLKNVRSLRFAIYNIDNWVLDTGAESLTYTRKHPLKIKPVNKDYPPLHLNNDQLKAMNFSEQEINFIRNSKYSFEYFYNFNFLHYKSATIGINTGVAEVENTQVYHKEKTDYILNYINSIVCISQEQSMYYSDIVTLLKNHKVNLCFESSIDMSESKLYILDNIDKIAVQNLPRYFIAIQNLDLEKYDKVLVWCRAFKVLFSYADLE